MENKSNVSGYNASKDMSGSNSMKNASQDATKTYSKNASQDASKNYSKNSSENSSKNYSNNSSKNSSDLNTEK